MSVTSDLIAAAAQLTADTARVQALVNPVLRTADCAVTVNQRVNADTSGGAFTATLPPSKADGDEYYFYDIARTWDVNNLTIDGNGHDFDVDGDTFDRLVCDQPARLVIVFYGGVLRVS